MARHVFREQNQTADWWADTGRKKKSFGAVRTEAHKKLKAILLGEKQHIPYIRGQKAYTHLVGYD